MQEWGPLKTMDQLSDYVSYRALLERQNGSGPYNFSGADDILAEFMGRFFTFSSYSSIVLLSLYVPVFLIGLVGNVLILVSVARDKTQRKAKSFYLINLALADLCVTLLCMPMTVGTIVYRLWVYGVFLCKATAFMQGVAVASSIFTLTAMSIDRYLALQEPVTSLRGTTPRQAALVILVTWVVSAIFMSPVLFVRSVDNLVMPNLPTMPFCIEEWPQDHDRRLFGVILLMMVYVIPACTLAACYAQVGRTLCQSDSMLRTSSDSSSTRMRSRRQAARILILLVVVFMLCWLPYNIISLTMDLNDDSGGAALLPFALWLGHAHSALDPIMYWMLSRAFRDRIRAMIEFFRDFAQPSASPAYV